jgi:hypothetical protein
VEILGYRLQIGESSLVRSKRRSPAPAATSAGRGDGDTTLPEHRSDRESCADVSRSTDWGYQRHGYIADRARAFSGYCGRA